MNKKKILQIILASTAFTGGIVLGDNSVDATEFSHDRILDFKESNNYYECYEGKVINSETNLSVKDGENTDDKVIGYLMNGDNVSIKGETEENYRIDFNGNDGYVSKEYVEISTVYKVSRSIEKGQVYNTGGEGLNIRQTATTNSSVIGRLKDGEIVQIKFKSGSWYNISYGNKTGFVHSKYIKMLEISDSNTSSAKYKGKVTNISSNLRVRQSPNTNSAIVGYLLNGQEVDIDGESGDWYRINFKGKVGYAHKDYITKIQISNNSGSSNSNNSNNNTTPERYEKDGIVKANGGLRVRSGAGTNSSILGVLNNGSSVKIIGESGDWYRIKYGSSNGYIHKDYVTIKSSSSNDNAPQEKPEVKPPIEKPEVNIQKGEVYNVVSNLRVRQAPTIDSMVLGYLVNGEKVDIIGSGGNWYKINFKGSSAFVSKDYIRILESKPEVKPEKPQEKPDPIIPEVPDNNGNTEVPPVTPPVVPELPEETPEIEAPEENLAIKSIGSVTVGNLNVRTNPSTSSDVKYTLTFNDIVEIIGEENGWYKIKHKDEISYVSSKYIKISTGLSDYRLTLDKFADLQSKTLNMVQTNGKWTNASIEDIKHYMNPSNFINNHSKYMFMKLNYVDGIPMSIINEVIEGRGILSGKANAFLEGAKQYNVNIMYLLLHARLETGNGTSQLSNGVLVTEVDGVPVEPKMVYNMYGIGAIDSDPIKGGSEYAYKQGWFTPELAITHGASWISRNYINNSKYNQNTLYKMKWNMSSNSIGWHQYASDIAWAEKQAKIIAPYLDRCGIAFEFDIPTFNK